MTDFNSVMDDVYKPTSLSDPAQFSKFQQTVSADGNNIRIKLESFRAAIESITPLLITAINNFSSAQYQAQHTKPSAISGAMGWMSEVFHGRWGLIANDFISAVNALNTLKESLKDAYKRASSIDSIKSQRANDIKVALTELKQQPKLQDLEDDDLDMPVKKKKPFNQEPPSNEDEEGYGNMARYIGHEPTAKELEFFRSLK